jgi:hypothetical protein
MAAAMPTFTLVFIPLSSLRSLEKIYGTATCSWMWMDGNCSRARRAPLSFFPLDDMGEYSSIAFLVKL